MELWLAIPLGIVTGILSGMFGIGGGIVLVPSLIYFMKYPLQTASATSLVAMLLPVGIFGVIKYYSSGLISGSHVKIGLMIAVGMFLGAFIGASIATQLPAQTMTRLFGVFLAAVSIKLIFF